MNISAFFKKNWIHFAAIGIFLIVCLVYFRLELSGHRVKQSDIEQFQGMSREIQDFREHNNGQEPLWTNGMFGGMPATQISVIHPGNWFSKMTTAFLTAVPSPLGIVLLYMLGFYIMLSLMKVNRWVSIVGSLTYGFLSYQLIILSVGHNSKGIAIAFMAPVVGAFIYAFRKSWIWGALLSAIFMSFELASNHLQVSYYLGFLLLGLGIVEVVKVFKSKEFMPFIKATAGILVGYLIAVIINYGNISITNDYAKYSIRGGNELTISPDGKTGVKAEEGLDVNYVTEYSYGIGETFSFITPYAKGAGTVPFGDSPYTDKVNDKYEKLITNATTQQESEKLQNEQKAVLNGVAYWGDQPATSGPVYIGVVVVLLALLGMVYIKDASKWAYLVVTILTVMLSWGKNYAGLTDWFLENVPLYNKFRAVTIILVIAELCIPLLAVLLVDKLIKERDAIKENVKPFYIVSGAYFVLLLGLKFAGIDDSYTWIREKDTSSIEAQFEQLRSNALQQIMALKPEEAQQYGIDLTNPQSIQAAADAQVNGAREEYESGKLAVKEMREEVYNSSMNRSLLIAFLAIGVLALYFLTSMSTAITIGALGLIAFLDVSTMSSNYLNSSELEDGSGYKYWTPKFQMLYPMTADQADMSILEAEIQSNPTLASKVEAGFKEGKAKAIELGADGLDARRIETAYGFSALNRNTNYRVYDQTGGFNSAVAAYFHKSLGGYHGAKLRSFQNLAEFHLYKGNNRVFDMMNVKYFIANGDSGRTVTPNMTALGNAWFVRRAEVVATANDEILALGSRFSINNIGTGKFLVNGEVKKTYNSFGNEKLQYLPQGKKDTLEVPLSNGVPLGVEVVFVQDINGKTDLIMKEGLDRDTTKSFTPFVSFKVTDQFKPIEEVVVSSAEAKKLKGKSWKGEGKITMTSYAPNELKYSYNASDNGMAVFSEVYYADGWKATIDGKPADIVRVNYLLRGLEVPKGKHNIVFKFESEKFNKVNQYSMIGSLLLILMTIGMLINSLLQKRKANLENQ